jgi:hypothetical protein
VNSGWDLTMRNIERAARQVYCRRCHMPPNRHCRSAAGKIRPSVHEVRFNDAAALGAVVRAEQIVPRDGFIL